MRPLFALVLGSAVIGAEARAQALVAHYTFENASSLGEDAQNSYDLTAFSNGGVLSPAQNTSLFKEGVASGDFGLSASAEGLRTTDYGLVALGEAFTISLWVNPDNASASSIQALVSSRVSTTNGVYMYLTTGNQFRFATYGTGGGNYNSGVTLAANTWTHLTVTFDGTTIMGYVNGVNVGTSIAASYTAPASGSSLFLGRRSTGNDTEYFNGQMDDVGIFDGALTPEQVLGVYNNGASPIPEPAQAALATSLLALALVGLRRKGCRA